MVVGILAIAVGLIVPVAHLKGRLTRTREAVRRAACQSNLLQLLKAEKLYARDHAGTYSQRLSDLYPKYATNLGLFTCPSAGGPIIRTKESIDSRTTYVLREGLTVASPPDAVLIYEWPRNHAGQGGWAVHCDGRVRWLSASRLERLVQEDLRK
jgi:hypothetical protein